MAYVLGVQPRIGTGVAPPGSAAVARSPARLAPPAPAVIRADARSPRVERSARDPIDRLLARAVLARAGEVEEMRATAGYKGLSDHWKERIDALVKGRTTLSRGAPAKLRELLDSPKLDKGDRVTFINFVRNAPFLPANTELPADWHPNVSPFSVAQQTPVKAYRFRGKTADALRHVVSIRPAARADKPALRVPVTEAQAFEPPRPGYVLPTADAVALALAELPLDSLLRITRIDLNPVPNPDDRAWAKDANYAQGGTFASSMSSRPDGSVTIYPSPDNEDLTTMVVELVHETGHIASDRALGATEDEPGWSAWGNAMVEDGTNVSTYGRSSFSDDFAEAWALWLPVRGTPGEQEVAAVIPNRVRFMTAVLTTGKAP
jgi:hypothetical protein